MGIRHILLSWYIILKYRVGDSGETSKSKIDLESIQLKKYLALLLDPSKAIPLKHMNAHCLITDEAQVYERELKSPTQSTVDAGILFPISKWNHNKYTVAHV